MAAAYKIIPGIVKITNITGQMKAYEFSASDLAYSHAPPASSNGSSALVSIQSVELKNISFAYKDLPVLNRFNLSIQKRDFVGIVGDSGKGKTTILNILLGFLPPHEGNVLINDVALKKDSLKVYWPSIAYVRQQSFFIHDTLLRNITLEEDNYNKSDLDDAISISGLETFIDQHPNGLDTIITENAKNISGGQQQRIAIARALYKNADMILLDEPFNELDEESETLLLEHFTGLAKQGKIVILITHSKASLRWCNKIVSLDEQ
jgi:ABC-type bacteriocin/lantibiotic exporter with double-glycine peptidase domain